MELTKLVAKPQLMKVEINDDAVCKAHSNGEPIIFWTWDRMSLNDFLSMVDSVDDDNIDKLVQNKLIGAVLDKDGNPVFADDKSVPMDLLAAIMNKLMEVTVK